MPTQDPSATSLRAKDHGVKLGSVNDALDVLSSGLPACIFTPEDLHPQVIELQNGLLDDWLTGAGRV